MLFIVVGDQSLQLLILPANSVFWQFGLKFRTNFLALSDPDSEDARTHITPLPIPLT